MSQNSSYGIPRLLRRWPVLASVGVAATAAVLIGVLLPRVASADMSWVGSAGADTALKPTDSASTVAWLAAHKTASSQSPFANLKVTVSQTTDLTNQAVSVTWTGGPPRSSYGQNWLQIMQCWGNEDQSNPDNPGPPPEQCEFGGQPFGQNEQSKLPGNAGTSFSYTRIMSSLGWPTFDKDKGQGYVDNNPDATYLWKPFRAVNGKVVNVQWHQIKNGNAGLYYSWDNQIYDLNTTNEDDWGISSNTGTGSELFQVDTGLEAPGLGCGQQVQPQPDGSKTVPKCWLVIVPRGTGADEGLGFPLVRTSPLTPEAWQNRIAIPLQFNPVDSPCSIGADPRRIVGGELASAAAASWQPTLCAKPGLPPYSYAGIGDSQARGQVGSSGYGAAGMAVVSRPLDPGLVDPANPVLYAPLTLSGLVIGFNLERYLSGSGKPIYPKAESDAEKALDAVRAANIKLTPRLVAKLLTESYKHRFPELSNPPPSGYDWLKTNPDDVVADPDFLQYNPEFNFLYAGHTEHAAGLVVEQAPADATYELWRWVLSDPEASAWLKGTADPWGMKVNPFYNTDSKANPGGSAFANPVPETFPANDPYCSLGHSTSPTPPTPPTPSNPSGTPEIPSKVVPLCVLDAHPQAFNMRTAAQETRATNDGAKTSPHGKDEPQAQSPGTLFGADGPDARGGRTMISVTDAASAKLYGLQTASLSRAGDDTPGRTFIAPDPQGFLAGEAAMVPSADPAVLQPRPTTNAGGAYPLTMLTYAAAAPRNLDQAARNDYASFITYGVTDGQTPGVHFGQLPPGYAPLPDNLRAQALATAALIRTGDPAAPENPGAPAPSPSGSVEPGGSTPGAGGTGTGGGGGGGGADTGTTLGPIGSPSPAASKIPSALAAKNRPSPHGSRTPWESLGAIRYVLPIAFAVGIVAALGSLVARKRRRKANETDLTPPGTITPVPNEAI